MKTRKYNKAQLIVDEHKYQIDINKDGTIFEAIKLPKFTQSRNFDYTNSIGVYKTESGALVFGLPEFTQYWR